MKLNQNRKAEVLIISYPYLCTKPLPKVMFGLFKKKTEKEKLYELYDKKKKEAFVLSKSNRKESDRLEKEAFDIMQKIEALERSN